MQKKTLIIGLMLLVATAAIITVASVSFLRQHQKEPIVEGPGVSKVVKLSEYFEGLEGTPGDTEVYILEGEEPGGSMLVLGGTHPTEPAGLLTAVLLVENTKLKSGRLFVIPHANASGFTWTEPGQGHPPRFYIKTEWGSRWFRFGARGTNPIHQWPDPELYIHAASGQRLSAEEIRNLNRCHPGRPDGLLTEKIAYGIRRLIETETIDVTIDLHEAPPEKPLINAACAHQRALDLAGWAALNLELNGIDLRLEASPLELHGLSHRELGDYTDTLAILLEVPNPSQGSIRGRTDETLVVEGKDEFYVAAAKLGRLFVPFDEEGHPIEERVGRHEATIVGIARAFTELYPDKPIDMEHLPSFEDIMEKGVGSYLLPVPGSS
jgi:hypothetical protein